MKNIVKINALLLITAILSNNTQLNAMQKDEIWIKATRGMPSALENWGDEPLLILRIKLIKKQVEAGKGTKNNPVIIPTDMMAIEDMLFVMESSLESLAYQRNLLEMKREAEALQCYDLVEKINKALAIRKIRGLI